MSDQWSKLPRISRHTPCELYTKGRTFLITELVALKFHPKTNIYRHAPLHRHPHLRRTLWEQRLSFVQKVDRTTCHVDINKAVNMTLRRCEIWVAGRVVKFIVTSCRFDWNNGHDPIIIESSAMVDGPGLENGELAAVNFDPARLLNNIRP